MRHPDFEKIYKQFQTRYGEEGEKNYLAWLSLMVLDETKPYSNEDQFNESFGWAKTLITRLKEEDGRRLYKVDACFPLSSMNRNVYTEAELTQAARMLRLVKSNLNHTDLELPFMNEGAQYEEGAVEVLMSTSVDAVSPMGYKYVDMLEHSPDVPEELHIVHVSIEGDCIGSEETDEGSACVGLGYTGIAYLTKKVLPGIPLTRIVPVERIVESFSPEGEVMEKPEQPEKDETVKEPVDPAKRVKPKLKSETMREQYGAGVDSDGPSLEQRVDWLEEDARSIRDGFWALDERVDLSIEAINKRIDDALILIAGIKTETVEPSSDEKAVGNYSSMEACIAANQDKADPAAYCASICKKTETLEEEPTSEPEKQEAEEPEEAESGEEAAPEEVEESVEAPTKFEFTRRYKELKEQGLSARDAWRRAGFEMIEHLQR